MKKRSRKLLAAVIMAAFGTTMMGLPAYAAEPEVHITPEQQQQYSDDSWIQEQADKEAAMEAELQSGDYTAENPYVEVDPYGNNPLAALVMFKTDKDTKVSVEVQIPAATTMKRAPLVLISTNTPKNTTSQSTPSLLATIP